MEEILVMCAIIAVIIVVAVVKAKKTQKDVALLLKEYKDNGGDYLSAMKDDLNGLMDEKAQIEPIIKEYNDKCQYVTKTYDAEAADVRRYYSDLKNRANRAGDVRSMNDAQSASSRECSAINSKKKNDLERLKSAYSDVLSKEKELNKQISIMRQAIKQAEK